MEGKRFCSTAKVQVNTSSFANAQNSYLRKVKVGIIDCKPGLQKVLST
jgi:hypothetical protein